MSFFLTLPCLGLRAANFLDSPFFIYSASCHLQRIGEVIAPFFFEFGKSLVNFLAVGV